MASKLRFLRSRRIAKFFALIFTLLFVVPMVMFVAYDLLVFQPYKAEIQQLLGRASADERAPGIDVVNAARASLSQHISAHTSRLLMQQINVLRRSDQELRGQLHNSLWWALVALHLSDLEQNTLFLSLAHMGGEVPGFSAASLAVFQASLSALSMEQPATLAAISKSPFYLNSPERLERARTLILARMRSGEVLGN